MSGGMLVVKAAGADNGNNAQGSALGDALSNPFGALNAAYRRFISPYFKAGLPPKVADALSCRANKLTVGLDTEIVKGLASEKEPTLENLGRAFMLCMYMTEGSPELQKSFLESVVASLNSRSADEKTRQQRFADNLSGFIDEKTSKDPTVRQNLGARLYYYIPQDFIRDVLTSTEGFDKPELVKRREAEPSQPTTSYRSAAGLIQLDARLNGGAAFLNFPSLRVLPRLLTNPHSAGYKFYIDSGSHCYSIEKCLAFGNFALKAVTGDELVELKQRIETNDIAKVKDFTVFSRDGGFMRPDGVRAIRFA